MKREYMVLTPKLCSGHQNGNRDRRIHCKHAANLVFSSVMSMLCTVIVLFVARLLTIILVYKCWGISVMQWLINGHRNLYVANGKFTMTMHLPTQPSLYGALLCKNGIPQVRQPPYSPDVVLYDLPLFSKLKNPRKTMIWYEETTEHSTIGQLPMILKESLRSASSIGSSGRTNVNMMMKLTSEGIKLPSL